MVKQSLDPLGVIETPNIPDSEDRIDELTTEFRKRLEYLEVSYQSIQATDNDLNGYNESLTRLKRSVRRKKPLKERGRRIHPELELLITHEACNILGLSDPFNLKDLTQEAIESAAQKVAETLKPKRKRPPNYNLRYHVKGLVALTTEFSGQRVTANRYRNSLYDPNLSGGVSQVIKNFFTKVDPSVTETQLANIVRDTRKEYAGKPMQFIDFFPLYGGSYDIETNNLNAGFGYGVKQFGKIAPIYCP